MAMVQKSCKSGKVSEPIVAVNPIYRYYSLWGALSLEGKCLKIFIWAVASHLRESFCVEGLTKPRNIEGDMSVFVNL